MNLSCSFLPASGPQQTFPLSFVLPGKTSVVHEIVNDFQIYPKLKPRSLPLVGSGQIP